MDTPDLRFPLGSGLIWPATEPGFYAAVHPQSLIDGPALFYLASVNRWPGDCGDKIPEGVTWEMPKQSPWAEKVLLGPYPTAKEARAAFKLYAFMLCATLAFPNSAFQEPDGKVAALNEWRQQPD